MSSNRFKYGCACCVISILISAGIFWGVMPPSLDIVSLVVFMLGLALMVEVD